MVFWASVSYAAYQAELDGELTLKQHKEMLGGVPTTVTCQGSCCPLRGQFCCGCRLLSVNMVGIFLAKSLDIAGNSVESILHHFLVSSLSPFAANVLAYAPGFSWRTCKCQGPQLPKITGQVWRLGGLQKLGE